MTIFNPSSSIYITFIFYILYINAAYRIVLYCNNFIIVIFLLVIVY